MTSIATDAAPEATPGRAGGWVGSRDHRMVSVVDHDESVRLSIRNRLVALGFHVRLFESAEAFLLSGRRNETGCLIVGLRTSGTSGLDLLNTEVAGRRVPTVVLAGDGMHGRRWSAKTRTVLQKPVHAGVLLEAITKVIADDQ
jgi:FixJ family two-component response regulator